MRAVSEPFGIPEAAVLAMAAGADLLCLGRDTSEEVYQAVGTALSDAVRAGRLPGQRLEEAADRVAALRSWLASAGAAAPGVAGQAPRIHGPGQAPLAGVNGTHIGLRAARRAVRLSGARPALTDPVIVEIEPRGNVAVGRAAWGLGPWAPPGSIRRVPAAPGPSPAAGFLPSTAAEIVTAAAGRSLVIVVRDAHRSENTRALVMSLLAERPDAVVVEMGLPVWQPPPGSSLSYVATYGASRANGQAAAEILGLT